MSLLLLKRNVLPRRARGKASPNKHSARRPRIYCGTGVTSTGFTLGNNFVEGMIKGTEPARPQSLPPIFKEIVNGVTDSTHYDPYIGGLKDAGGIVGTGFTQGVEDSLNVSIEQGLNFADSKTIANKLLGTPEEIGMIGLEAGERYAADFYNRFCRYLCR